MLVIGIVGVVVGVMLLSVALRPRPRTGVALAANTGVHLRRSDVARVAEAAMDGVDAVTDVTVKVRRRKVRVNLSTFAASERHDALTSAASERLDAALAALRDRPVIVVVVRSEAS